MAEDKNIIQQLAPSFKHMIIQSLQQGASIETVLEALSDTSWTELKDLARRPDINSYYKDGAYIMENHPYSGEGFHDVSGKKPKPLYNELADFVEDVMYLKSCNGYHWIFEDGFFQQRTSANLRALVEKLTHGLVSPKEYGNFINKLAARTDIINIERVKESTSGLINMNNGILDVQTRELHPHNPNKFFTYKLTHDYARNAPKPVKWLKWLEWAFKGDQELIDVSAEIFGYCMMGGSPFLHKAFVLYGTGRNGKSVFLEVLRWVLGEENCSSIGLSKLANPFSVVGLDGKLANIVSEEKNKKLDPEDFKTAVGGEGLIAAKKFKDEFTLRIQARFVFACNNLPHFGDQTPGLVDKLFFLPFDQYLEDHERVEDIHQQFKAELPGIVNWSLDGLSRMMARPNKRLPKVAATQYLLDMYKEESCTVYNWIQNSGLFTKNPDHSTANSKLFAHYCTFTERAGSHSVNKNNFLTRCRTVQKACPELAKYMTEDKRTSNTGVRERASIGFLL